MVTLQPWSPNDAVVVPLVDLLRRAEAETLKVVGREARSDGGGSPAGVEPAIPRDKPVQVPTTTDCARTLPRTDALDDAWPRIAATIRAWLSNDRITTTLRRVGDDARQASDRQWSAELGRAVGVGIPVDSTVSRELVEAWIAENTARIQGLRDATLELMRADIETAVLSGTRPEELAAKWEREGLPTRHGRLRGRATVIARHQLGLLATQIAEHQAQSIGATSYRWDSRDGDRRDQRPVHRGRDGAVYRWSDPPPGGHPRTEVGCRCAPAVVVDGAELRRRFVSA